MTSSEFPEDELVIDVHDEFGSDPGKLDQRYQWRRRSSVPRTWKVHQNTCLLFRELNIASVQNLIAYKELSWLSTTTRTQLLALQTRARCTTMFLESLAMFGRKFAHGDTSSRADEWDRAAWSDSSTTMCQTIWYSVLFWYSYWVVNIEYFKLAGTNLHKHANLCQRMRTCAKNIYAALKACQSSKHKLLKKERLYNMQQLNSMLSHSLPFILLLNFSCKISVRVTIFW